MTSFGDGRCPVCGAALWAPDSEAVGCKTCPRCGAELWALGGPDRQLFFRRRPGESRYAFLAGLTGPLFGSSPEQTEQTLRGADSLDLVEIVLEVEEAIRSGRR